MKRTMETKQAMKGNNKKHDETPNKPNAIQPTTTNKETRRMKQPQETNITPPKAIETKNRNQLHMNKNNHQAQPE